MKLHHEEFLIQDMIGALISDKAKYQYFNHFNVYCGS